MQNTTIMNKFTQDTQNQAVINFMFFLANYPQGFIQMVWNNHLAQHLQDKFNGMIDRHGTNTAYKWFYELDNDNRHILANWIAKYYSQDEGFNSLLQMWDTISPNSATFRMGDLEFYYTNETPLDRGCISVNKIGSTVGTYYFKGENYKFEKEYSFLFNVAWILESGSDCDGSETRGSISAYNNLAEANEGLAKAWEFSDGLVYTLTEDYNEVTKYKDVYDM